MAKKKFGAEQIVMLLRQIEVLIAQSKSAPEAFRDPSLIRQRRCAFKHPFGTIKRMTAGGRFLTRGLKKVSGEAALSVLAYNIIRTINLVGAATLRASLA